jgi:tripartite motif-containing protein 2/3/tripartite motif-containing protein 71
MTCELTSENDTKTCTIEGSVKKVKDNQYKISYCPKSPGRHQLHIKFDGKHISASPFAVIVRTKKLGTPVMTITGLKGPWGVIVNKKGEIIVIENCAHRVSVYSQAGEKLRSFGSLGSGEGQFQQPRGVAVDDDDNILVADAYNDRIQKFSADGQFVTVVGSHGVKPLQFDYPTGIAIHPINKRVYVSDSSNYRVQILNSDLTAHNMFGSEGSDKGEFYCPRGIAFDSKQNVYVGEERSNTCIQVFTAEGEHLQWLGDTKLNRPFDVCFDSNDIAYVCDTDNHRICIFDSSGKLLRSFGTKGKSSGQFKGPFGITVDKNGLLYVSDHYNGRVQIF